MTVIDGAVTLCALRAATLLSRNCCADFGRPLTKKVMSHSLLLPGFLLRQGDPKGFVQEFALTVECPA